jgi:cell envelope opacity-associated protein A
VSVLKLILPGTKRIIKEKLEKRREEKRREDDIELNIPDQADDIAFESVKVGHESAHALIPATRANSKPLSEPSFPEIKIRHGKSLTQVLVN